MCESINSNKKDEDIQIHVLNLDNAFILPYDDDEIILNSDDYKSTANAAVSSTPLEQKLSCVGKKYKHIERPCPFCSKKLNILPSIYELNTVN